MPWRGGKPDKLSVNFQGPFEVTKRLSNSTYEIRDPADDKLRRVHVDELHTYHMRPDEDVRDTIAMDELENLVEEIVGEIEDEHDTTAQLRFDQKSDGTAIADARLEVEMLESITGPLLDDDERDEIDTLGGLVFSIAGRVPGHGEVVRHRAGIQFEILEGDPRRITLLKLRGLPRVYSSVNQE